MAVQGSQRSELLRENTDFRKPGQRPLFLIVLIFLNRCGGLTSQEGSFTLRH
jgi:hypothetical protein